jgi:hypothetical protein
VKYHPLLMNWAITFLACMSARVYAEVAKIMMLLHISHVCRKTVELVSIQSNKAFGLHINTIRSTHEGARCKKWTRHQRIGAVGQVSANISATNEHVYVSNMLKGGNHTHCLATLLQMFTTAQQVRDAESSTNLDGNGDSESGSATALPQEPSIFENLP